LVSRCPKHGQGIVGARPDIRPNSASASPQVCTFLFTPNPAMASNMRKKSASMVCSHRAKSCVGRARGVVKVEPVVLFSRVCHLFLLGFGTLVHTLRKNSPFKKTSYGSVCSGRPAQEAPPPPSMPHGRITFSDQIGYRRRAHTQARVSFQNADGPDPGMNQEFNSNRDQKSQNKPRLRYLHTIRLYRNRPSILIGTRRPLVAPFVASSTVLDGRFYACRAAASV